jgi:peptidoglycan-binding protein ArfA
MPGSKVIGNSADTRAISSVNLTAPAVAAPSANPPGMAFAPLSIVRAGNDVTLSGDLPDGATKAALLDTLRGAFGPDVNVIDKLNIKSGASALRFSGLGGLFKAAANIPDFNFDLNGDAVTLTRMAPSGDIRVAVDAAAKAELPNRTMANNIRVQAGAPTPPVAAPAAAGAAVGDILGSLLGGGKK